MDLTQRKLTRHEWNSIEKPVTTDELQIIRLIQDGYKDVNIKRNTTLTIIQHLKVDNRDDIDTFVFIRYIQKQLISTIKYSKKYPIHYSQVSDIKYTVRKSDLIRIGNTDSQLDNMKQNLFEFILLDILKTTLKTREKQNDDWVIGLFTLQSLLKHNIDTCNRVMYSKISLIVRLLIDETEMTSLVYRSVDLIERNPFLLRYSDEELYDHQKKLFSLFKNTEGRPQLVLYIAPTGTGKTLSPIGLTKQYKVIFVCAARHVGLAIAKASISANLKVAFAFGCNDATDIRLHYGAAKEYTKDRKSGSISKVDNALGDRVEIIISDIKSYIPAMNYMCAFNPKENIITYWDEPTISLDYTNHPCHEIIKKNWCENIIPNMVLSSATLPCEEELVQTISDFKARFDCAEITTIVSYECKKTIPLINKSGFVEVPHFMYKQYTDVKECAIYCLKNKTLLRYIDLDAEVEFIKLINTNYPSAILHKRFTIESQITDISMINMLNIKTYYLTLLKNVDPDEWSCIYKHASESRKQRHGSNVLVSTSDAHTLTDGPTIFLAEDVDKIGKFCLQRANIPSNVLSIINDTILFNSVINKKITSLSKELEDMTAKDELSGNDKKLSNISRGSPELKKIRKDLEDLHKCIKTVELPEKYVPNMSEHLKIYGCLCKNPERTFKPSLREDDIEKIMLIEGIDDIWKLLLMMGIGVFATHDNIRYTEIMKSLAHQQKLYLIIASTDFIYGTNYQFCHVYISTDLEGMTQEKTIQALWRVGRNKLQYDYTMRFRNDNIIYKLFKHNAFKPEVENMAKLFNT